MLVGVVPWDPGGSNVVKVWPQAEGCAAIASKANNTPAPVRSMVLDFIMSLLIFRFSSKRSWVQVCLGERDNCVPRTVLCLCRRIHALDDDSDPGLARYPSLLR